MALKSEGLFLRDSLQNLRYRTIVAGIISELATSLREGWTSCDSAAADKKTASL